MSKIPHVELQVDPLDEAEIGALKALARGDAAPYQQQLALQVITNKFSRANDLLYVPGRMDATSFLNGRAYVGALIMKTLKQRVGHLTIEKIHERNPSD